LESRDILEERELPEREKVLTSKRYMTTAAGKVLRETRIAFCDWCGSRLDNNRVTIICCICGRKLCNSPSCATSYEGRHYCEDDLQQILPLEKLQFKVIHGLVYGLSLDKIKELTHCQREEFDPALEELLNRKYIEKKGISIFAYYQVLDHGILAWKTYYDAFMKGDVAHFIEEIDNHVAEENENAPKRHNRNAR
jgi:hypothetical protein